MKVLLLEDVDNLGLAGDVKKVANGYGRNYLIPQQMAVLATKGALKQSVSVRKVGELKRAREKADAEAIAGQVNGAVLVFERRAGDQDKLYGSVTATEITQALNDKYGLDIHKRKVSLPEPIRTLGEWDITIKLMVEVSAQIKVVVVNEDQAYQAEAEAAVEVEETVAETIEAPAVEAEVIEEDVAAEAEAETETEEAVDTGAEVETEEAVEDVAEEAE